MRTFKIVVLSLALALTAGPAPIAGSAPTADPQSATRLASLEGAGLWATLKCAACLGGGAALVISGWGGALYLASSDGTIAGACLDVCVAAF